MAPRLALLGAGNWGKNHLKILYELGVLASVVDPSPDTRTQVQSRYPDLKVYPSPEPLWQEGVEGVVIATPAATHAELALMAMEHGCDVLVEKPMAMSSRDARRLVHLAEKRGRILMVGHLLLYQPAIPWIKEFLAEGRLGRLLRIEQLRLNFGRARAVENALLSLGVHDLAVLLYLLDAEPHSVEFRGESYLTPGVEDDCHLFLKFPGGVSSHLHASWFWYEKDRRMILYGEKGMLVFLEERGEVYFHRKWFSPDLTQADEGYELLFSGKEEPLRRELEAFLHSMKTREPPLASGENGFRVIRVLEQAMRSKRRVHGKNPARL